MQQIKFLTRKVEIVDRKGIGRILILPIITLYVESKNNFGSTYFRSPVRVKIISYDVEEFLGEVPQVTYIDYSVRIIDDGENLWLEPIN